MAQRYCPMAPSILTKPGWAIVHTAQPSVTLLRVDNEKVGVDNEKALELDNRIFFFIFQSDFNKYTNIAQKCNILLHSGMMKQFT